MNKYQRSLMEASWGELAALGSIYRACLGLHLIRDQEQLDRTKSAIRELSHRVFPGTISSRKPKNDILGPCLLTHWPFGVLPKLVVIAPATLTETVVKYIEAIDGLPDLLNMMVETVEYGEKINDGITAEFDIVNGKLDIETAMDFTFIMSNRDKKLGTYTTALEHLKKVQDDMEIQITNFHTLTNETFKQWAKYLPKKATT